MGDSEILAAEARKRQAEIELQAAENRKRVAEENRAMLERQAAAINSQAPTTWTGAPIVSDSTWGPVVVSQPKAMVGIDPIPQPGETPAVPFWAFVNSVAKMRTFQREFYRLKPADRPPGLLRQCQVAEKEIDRLIEEIRNTDGKLFKTEA